jgi:hypothetical protein
MYVMLQITNPLKTQWLLYILSGLALENVTFCIYVPYVYQNKRRLFHYTTLTDRLL